MKIISQKLITDPLDILDESIIDFNRLNGVWQKPGDAIRTIFSWFDQKATMTIVEIPDFPDAPSRNDFPEWQHSGNHLEIGKAYWNWFFWNHPEGNLRFSDSPDFFGQFVEGERFWGDIGRVSASAFAYTQKSMGDGDLWVSVLGNGSRQVLIESHIDIPEIYGEMIFGQAAG